MMVPSRSAKVGWPSDRAGSGEPEWGASPNFAEAVFGPRGRRRLCRRVRRLSGERLPLRSGKRRGERGGQGWTDGTPGCWGRRGQRHAGLAPIDLRWGPTLILACPREAVGVACPVHPLSLVVLEHRLQGSWGGVGPG